MFHKEHQSLEASQLDVPGRETCHHSSYHNTVAAPSRVHCTNHHRSKASCDGGSISLYHSCQVVQMQSRGLRYALVQDMFLKPLLFPIVHAFSKECSGIGFCSVCTVYYKELQRFTRASILQYAQSTSISMMTLR